MQGGLSTLIFHSTSITAVACFTKTAECCHCCLKRPGFVFRFLLVVVCTLKLLLNIPLIISKHNICGFFMICNYSYVLSSVYVQWSVRKMWPTSGSTQHLLHGNSGRQDVEFPQGDILYSHSQEEEFLSARCKTSAGCGVTTMWHVCLAVTVSHQRMQFPGLTLSQWKRWRFWKITGKLLIVKYTPLRIDLRGCCFMVY